MELVFLVSLNLRIIHFIAGSIINDIIAILESSIESFEAKANDDALQNIKDNQEITIKANESRTRVRVTKG